MRLLYICLLTILISSCSPYGHINFEAKKPAKIQIPQDAKSVCFVIRQTIPQKVHAIIDSTPKQKEFYEYNLNINNLCFEGFYDILNRTSQFDRIMYYKTDVEVVADSVELEPLNWIQVGQICNKTGSDLLVVLEKSKLSVGAFDNTIVSWDYRFRCYDPYTFSIINYSIYNSFKSYNNNGDEYRYSIQEGKEIASYKLGEKYAKQITPETVKIERLYYNKGNNLLRLGSYYLEQNQYDKAISVWKELIESSKNKEIAYKACINISLAEEMRYNFKASLRYASLSLHYIDKQKKSSEYKESSSELIKALRIRNKEYKIRTKHE